MLLSSTACHFLFVYHEIQQAAQGLEGFSAYVIIIHNNVKTLFQLGNYSHHCHRIELGQIAQQRLYQL